MRISASGNISASAPRFTRACCPAPTIVAIRLSGRARARAPMAVMPAGSMVEVNVPSIIAMGVPRP